MTMKSAPPDISTQWPRVQAQPTFQRLRQHRSAADGEPFRNHDAFRRRIKSLERRMQQEGAAFIFGETAVFRNQNEVLLQADDGFERSKSAGLDAEIAGRVGEAGIGQ